MLLQILRTVVVAITHHFQLLVLRHAIHIQLMVVFLITPEIIILII